MNQLPENVAREIAAWLDERPEDWYMPTSAFLCLGPSRNSPVSSVRIYVGQGIGCLEVVIDDAEYGGVTTWPIPPWPVRWRRILWPAVRRFLGRRAAEGASRLADFRRPPA